MTQFLIALLYSRSHAYFRAARKRRELKLTSVQNLKNAVEENTAEELQSMIKGMKFVGCVTESHAAFQFEVRIVNLSTASYEKLCLFNTTVYLIC